MAFIVYPGTPRNLIINNTMLPLPERLMTEKKVMVMGSNIAWYH